MQLRLHSLIFKQPFWFTLCFTFTIFALFHVALGDLYKILNVDKSASESEIKSAFRELAKTHHPDKSSDPKANEKFAKIVQAYEILSNKEKREQYDRYGMDDQGNLNGPTGFDFLNFGFQNSNGRGERMRKGPDILIPLSVTMKELFTGMQLKFEVDRQTICHHCKGSGADSPDELETCHRCKGHGMIVVQEMIMHGMYTQSTRHCDVCNGKGKIIKTKCHVCKGKKVERKREVLKLKLPSGAPFGHRIKFQKKADESPDYHTGDLIVEVKLDDPKTIFVRENDNLYVTQHLGLHEALLGFKKTLTHLDGSEAILERKGVTQPGFVDVIKNKGMPNLHNSRQRGHIYVKYEVVFPTSFSKSDLDDLSKILVAK